ncbi:proton-coupled folate transporter-like [Glandiceps talaboti]
MGIYDYIRVVTVEPACMLFTWAIFMQGPATQQLLIQKICESKYNQTVCNNLDKFSEEENAVQSVASHWVFYITACLAIPCIGSSLFICSWSDTIGRKIPMLIPSCGSVLGSMVMIILSMYMHLPYQLILINSFLIGVGGGFGTFNVLAVTYISDITDIHSRTKRIGLLHAMIFVGGTIGLVTGGLLKDHLGFTSVYVLCLSLHVVLLMFVSMWIKESLRVKEHDGEPLYGDSASLKSKRLCTGLCSLSNAKRAAIVTFKKRDGNKRKHLLILISVNFLVLMCIAGQFDLIVLYTQHSPLNWPASTLGIYGAFNNVLQATALLVFLPLYMRCTSESKRLHDITLGQIGFCFSVLGYLLICLSSTTPMMFMASLTALVSPLPMAVLPSLRSKLVDHNELGAMFAFTVALEPLFAMLGSLLFNNLYPKTLSFNPGFSFVVMSVIIFIPVLLLQIIGVDVRKGTKYKQLKQIADDLDQASLDLSDDSDTEVNTS